MVLPLAPPGGAAILDPMTEHSGRARIREASVAGLFYPEEAALLAEDVARLLDRAPAPPEGRVGAILSPHAGFGYSGDLAAAAWKAASSGSYSSVVVLSPRHRAEEASVYLPEADWFDCPLGAARVDAELLAEIEDCGTIFERSDIPHFEEHGVELQLPFLRYLFPEASIAPLLLGRPSPAAVKALASALALVLAEREDCLLVISADLSADADPARAAYRSDILLNAVARGDWRGILELESRGETGACASGCLAAFLASGLAEGARPLLLGRHDSAAARASREEDLVEYAAMAWTVA